MKSISKTRVMVECAVLVALSVVLSLIKVWQMPLGGSITLVSMLPVCIASIRHGVKWGFLSSCLYAVVQLFLGITVDGLLGWGLTPAMLIGCMVFDYLAAFAVLGVAGAFRKQGKAGVYAGITLAMVLRFVSHFLSGYVIFTNLEQWELFGSIFEGAPALYSIAYNGFYMLPELIITMVVFTMLYATPLKKFLLGLDLPVQQ